MEKTSNVAARPANRDTVPESANVLDFKLKFK